MFFTINLYSIIMLRCPWKNCPSIKCSEIRFSTHWIAFSIIWVQVNGSRKITIMLSMLISTNRYAGTREKFWWLSSLREKLNTRSGYFSTIISEIPAVCSQVKNHCNFSGVYWRLQLSHVRSDQGEGQWLRWGDDDALKLDRTHQHSYRYGTTDNWLPASLPLLAESLPICSCSCLWRQ